jgi:excisionase family DNA binding protein
MTNKPKQQSLPEKLLTETEVSHILGCSVRTIRRRIEAGELAVIRDGRLKRIQPEDLRIYIRNRRFG